MHLTISLVEEGSKECDSESTVPFVPCPVHVKFACYPATLPALWKLRT